MLPAAPELFGLSPAAPALDAIRAERRSGGPERVVPALDTAACKALAGIGCCAAACVPGGLRGFASLQRASDMLSEHSMPQWHYGYGQTAFLFVDEVIVE